MAVALNRGSKAVNRAARASRSAKSTGRITLRPMMENTISIWFNQEACTGRCTNSAVGQAVCIRSTEAAPACEEPLSTTQNTRRAEA